MVIQVSIRSKRIKSLIEQSKLSYIELEKKTGIKKSSLQRYASGVTSKIPLDVIEKLSLEFNVSQEYLMGWSDEENPNTTALEELKLTEGEKVWLELYNKISKETREVLIDVATTFDKLPTDTQNFLLGAIRVALKNQK